MIDWFSLQMGNIVMKPNCANLKQFAEQEQIYFLYLSSLVKKEAWTWGVSPASDFTAIL